ncbi:MAG: hypothetical protein KAU94_11390 [Verrucomicrobia bacterium]|nr:hypothetical protein [Verrucomicrobiota bacterium]
MNRTRKKTTLTISTINAEFIRDRILAAYPDYCQDRFTRGLHLVVDHVLNHLNGDMPKIPPRERDGETPLEMVDATFMPGTMDGLDCIVDFWRGTNGQTSRSAVVDHFLDVRREAQDIRDAKE